jgi:hypothetical protein
MVEQEVARGAEVLLDVPPALWLLLLQPFEGDHKLVTGAAVLECPTAPVDVLLAFRLVLAPFQSRVRLLPGFPVRPGIRLVVQPYRDLLFPEVDNGG